MFAYEGFDIIFQPILPSWIEGLDGIAIVSVLVLETAVIHPKILVEIEFVDFNEGLDGIYVMLVVLLATSDQTDICQNRAPIVLFQFIDG